ncbi:hypothetical protein Y032_0629g845 [Ancylostoma ceylanicum]|uniref:Uncharacterized protein n=1 Tax=Ancylostoma ceylanicum TaxID=53326 RepID=A0A016WM77_9BILA|nr:hypothetical protein Y032_0629g845 [Ancylostoma ceylanicum]
MNGKIVKILTVMFHRSEVTDVTKTPFLDKVKVRVSWSWFGSAPSCAGRPPQQQRRVNTSWPVRSMRSTVIHVLAREFAPANCYKPVPKRRLEAILGHFKYIARIIASRRFGIC